jgi:anti-sigma-K factor RskA
MNCSEYQDLLIPYALAALNAEERERVHAHLQSGCAHCAAELADIQATLAQLPLTLDPVSPPAQVRARLLSRLSAEGNPSASRPDSTLIRVPPRRWRWAEPLVAGGLAAAITAAVLWVKIDRQQQDLADLRTDIARQEARVDQLQTSLEQEGSTIWLFASPAVQLVAMKGSPEQPAAKGRVFWDTDREAFHLYACGLKPLDPGKAYEMWFIGADQKKIPAGTFTVNTRGEASLSAKPPAGTGKIAAVAVTAEPAGGSPQPTGHILLMGQAG